MEQMYRPAYISEIQSALAGKPQVDLYVFIPTADKYLVFVRKDQELSASKLENLRRLSSATLFVLRSESEVRGPESDAPASLAFLDPDSSFRNEVLGVETAQVIQDSYKELIKLDEKQGSDIPARLISMSDKILEALAPETEDLKQVLLKNLMNLNIMSHAAAISALALLTALSNDFSSRTALRQLCHACILMDAGLGDLEDGYLEQYYRDRSILPAHVVESIRLHPVRSQQLLSKFPEVSDSTGQLILLHHELHNGKGYHRGIRTGNVLPLARVLAFGVDLYERIKGDRMNNGRKNLKVCLLEFKEAGIDPHLRRHSHTLVENVYKYLKITA
jgi:HD-GYP domain-containing protein (c-di-GMP phosphodiesterase class II)